jgi:hypothetical protein
MKTLAASLLTLTLMASAGAEAPTVDYRFDEVKRKVTLTTPKSESRVEKGHRAQSGDKVSTGLFSYALIASDRYKAKFEIFSSTDVQLAGGTPGVILSLERGRLHAMFDKLTGTEPRVVQTPGALLAVRGTQYTVEVDKAGHTTLDVFEGIVEVRSELRREPILIRAGQESVFSRREAPNARPMPPERGPNGAPNRGGDHGDARGGPDGGGHQPPSHGPGQGPGSQPPPMPMPRPPGKH